MQVNKKIDAKIIALDLDDTLLKNDLTISDYTVDVLQRAVQNQIYIVLCSGRTENAILPYVHKLSIAGSEFGRYMISQNGATIYDMHKRLPIYECTVEPEFLISAYHFALEENLTCEVYDSSTIYSPFDNEWARVDKNLTGLNLEIVKDFESFLQKRFPKMVIPGEPEILQKLQTKLKKEFGDKAVIFTSKPYFLEVLPANCGKGEALKHLAENVLELSQKQTMCFGDSMNDESMIRYAFYSTAMCNGLEEIKKMAAFTTTKSNDQDGVATFIDQNVL